MCRQGDDLVAGLRARDGHGPVLVSAGKEFVVGAPGPGNDSPRMDDLRGQSACTRVPDVDRAVRKPGSHATAVGTERHGADGELACAKDPDLDAVHRLPDVDRSVVAPGGQLRSVRTPGEPP